MGNRAVRRHVLFVTPTLVPCLDVCAVQRISSTKRLHQLAERSSRTLFPYVFLSEKAQEWGVESEG